MPIHCVGSDDSCRVVRWYGGLQARAGRSWRERDLDDDASLGSGRYGPRRHVEGDGARYAPIRPEHTMEVEYGRLLE
jgi:hypothetical protein